MPLLMQKLERRAWFRARPALHAPFQVSYLVLQYKRDQADCAVQVAGVGCFLLLMVPTGCALFPQYVTVNTAELRESEPEAWAELRRRYGDSVPTQLHYNKGL